MKTVSIGDTHGISVAEHIENIIHDHDKFILIGDYVDSSYVDNQAMKSNLLDLVELKKKYPEKVVLLWGNHDIHYLLGERHYCSGFRPEMKKEFNMIFRENEHLFQLAFQVGGVLWTHAGVSDGWFVKRLSQVIKYIQPDTISMILNNSFNERLSVLFDVGYERGGSSEFGGPLWCDKEELEAGLLKGFNQIVGHNRVKKFETILLDDREAVLIDKLENEKNVSAYSFYYREV